MFGSLRHIGTTALCSHLADLTPPVAPPSEYCVSIHRDWAGISLSQYVSLNPLALCGLLAPTPGALVCSGDQLAFCSQRYRTVSGDTCTSITSLLGSILSLGSVSSCSSLVPNTEVCVAPATNAVSAGWCTVRRLPAVNGR